MREPFAFGIPLIARASSRNWPLVEALFALTLASVRAQTHADFRVVVAGHEAPTGLSGDARISFIQADWAAEPVRADNLDSGRKKHVINARVLAQGGGLLMFLDADDWVDTRLVETARRVITPQDIGGVVASGFATDLQRLRAVAIPHPRVFDGDFHRICGSSTVARLASGDPDPLRRDPYAVMHEHYRWLEVARDRGVSVVRLPVAGNYVVNTSANHSEGHGPFSDWRRTFAEDVGREGADVDDAFLGRFGLSLAQIEAALGTLPPGIFAS